MAQPDIQVLIVKGNSELTEAMQTSLGEYRQVGFGLSLAEDVSEALIAVKDRDIEIVVIDTCTYSGVDLLREFLEADVPVPVVAITGDDPNEVMEMGAAEHCHASKIATSQFPRTVVMLWVQSKHKAEQSDGDSNKIDDTPESRLIVDEQRDIIQRFQQVEVTLDAIMPEDGRSFEQLGEEEKLGLKLQLVQAYIDITKIYFARGDEESEELIRKFCANLASLRYPPKELTSIHMAALELMLTEPGQPHRRGLISQNRLVFIDILLNLLGFYHGMLADAEGTA